MENYLFSNDERYFCVDARGEIRIHDLKSLDLVDIITYEQIINALTLARIPRKILKWAITSEYEGIIHAEDPRLLWVAMYGKHVGIFLLDIEDRTIVSPVKNPIEIAKKNNLLASLNYLPSEKPWEGERKTLVGVFPTPTNNLLVALYVPLRHTNVPQDKEKRRRLGIPPRASYEQVIFLLNTDLDIVHWKRSVEIEGKEYYLDSWYASWPDYLLLGNRFTMATMSLDPKDNFHGIIGLDWRTLDVKSYVYEEDVRQLAFDVLDVDRKKYRVSIFAGEFVPRVYGEDILIPITVKLRGVSGTPAEVILAKTDWKAKKMRIIESWIGVNGPEGEIARFKWGALV